MVSKRTRLISGLVAILMLVSMFTAFSVPVIADTVSVGSSTETGLADASGLPDITTYDAAAPAAEYKVTSYEGMKALSELVYGGKNLDNITIYQANDIDMGGVPFPSIGKSGTPFSGTFDGNGFTIDNLYALRNDEAATGVGIFGELSGAEIRNVGISGGLVVGRNATGAIAGVTAAGSTNVIRNCWNAATVVGAYDNGTSGILGHARAGSNTIENCYNLGMIFNTAKTAAGILGWSVGGSTTVKNCYNAGEIVTGFNANAAYTQYSAIFAVDMAQTYVAGSNNYYIKNRGILLSIDEYKAAYGREEINAVDGATGLDAAALTDGSLATKLGGMTSNVSGWELSFTDVGAGYPVITYTQPAAAEGESDIVIARAAKSAINVNGAQSWVAASELFAKVYAARNVGLTSSTLSNVYIRSANDLFVLALITVGSNFKSALGASNNGVVYLANDVDMKDQTLFPETEYALPISSGGGVFNGTFYGQKNVIYNWNAYAYFTGGQGVAGLFPQANGTIQDLGMANATSTYERIISGGYAYPALMVERIQNNSSARLVISNCFTTGTLNLVDVSNHNNNGGVVSTTWFSNSSFTNCWADVDIIGDAADGHTKSRVIGKIPDGFTSAVSNCYYVADAETQLTKTGSYGKVDNGVWYHLRNSRLPESHYSSKDGSLAAYFNSIGYGSWTMKNGTTVFKKDTDSMYKVTLLKMINDETGYVADEHYYAPGDTVTIPGEIDGYTRRLGGATIQMPENDLTIEYTKEGFDQALAEMIAAKYGNGQYDAELFENGASVVQAYESAAAALAAADEAAAIENLAVAVAHANKVGEPVLKMEEGAYPYYSKKSVYAPLMPSQDWGISSRADWEQVIVDSPSNSFGGYVFHFNNDVDFGDTPIAPVNAANKKAFSGTVDGHGFKITNLNINWDVADGRWVGLIGYANGAAIKDLTIENGSVRAYGTNTGEHMVASFIGEGYNSIVINCWNNADISATDMTTTKGGQSVSGIGRFTGSSVIDACVNTGDISAIGYAYGISAYAQGTTYVVNCFTTGKLQGNAVGLARYNGGNKDAYMANSYIIGYDYCQVQNHATEAQWRLEEKDVASGVLSGLLNYNYYNVSTVSLWRLNPYYTDGSRPYYMTDENGDVVRCTSAEQTRTLTMECEGHETKYLYGENGDTVTLNYADNVTYEMDSGSGTLDNEAGTFTFAGSNAVLYVTNHGKLYDVLDAELSRFEGVNTEFLATEGVDDFGAFLASVREKRANDSYVDQAEIDADIEKLAAAYLYTTYPNLPKASQYDTHAGFATQFIVDSLDELNYVASNKGKFSATTTLHLAADIAIVSGAAANDLNGVKASIDGHDFTVSGFSHPDGWLGDYGNGTIKNITFEDCHATGLNWGQALLVNNFAGSSLTFENVTFIDCSATKASANGASFMVAQTYKGKTITYRNIVFDGCTLGGTVGGNVGFLGGAINDAVTVDGVVMRNCTYSATVTWGHGLLFGELTGNGDIKNVYIANNSLGSVGRVNGLLIGAYKTQDGGGHYEPVLNLTNIVTHDNGITAPLINRGNTTGKFGAATNVYSTDSASIIKEVANDKAADTADMASGLAAYSMNQAGAHWTTSNGKAIPTAQVEGAADTIAVTLKAADVLYDIMDESKTTATLYTDAEGNILGLDAIKDDLNKWAIWDFDAIEAATYDVDNNAAYGTPFMAHEHVWSYTAGNGTHDAECIWEGNGQACPWYVEDVACAYTEGAETVDPNAAPADAKHSGTCVCGNVSEEALCSSDADNWVVTVTRKATCYEAGNTTYVCLTCGYIANEAIAQREHSITAWVADKNEDGSFKYTHTAVCDHADPACDYSETADCSFADEWTQLEAPSIAEEGEEVRYCTDGCGAYETRAIAASTGFAVESQVGLRGDTMEVYVDIVNNPGISGAVIDITYDSANIELAKAELVINQKDQQIPTPGLTEGEGTMVTSTVSFAFYGDYAGEDLLKLTFNVKESAAVGKHSITVTTEEHAVANYDLEWVEVEDWTGEIEIADFIRGDVDRDRIVTIIDAVLLLRYSNALTEDEKTALVETHNFDVRAADIDGMEGVTVADVIKVLQYLNHMIDEI